MLVFNTSLLEGTGLVTLEAQRCGTPVLHLNRAHIPEPVTRLSVGCEDPSDMAEKAYALISDPEAYDDLCRRSK
jgi:glycosyltransferase involved in cell wall biosynthesis